MQLKQWKTTIDLPHVDMIIFPTSACLPLGSNTVKSIVFFHSSACLLQDFCLLLYNRCSSYGGLRVWVCDCEHLLVSCLSQDVVATLMLALNAAGVLSVAYSPEWEHLSNGNAVLNSLIATIVSLSHYISSHDHYISSYFVITRVHLMITRFHHTL